MKRILIVIIVLFVTLTASAQQMGGPHREMDKQEVPKIEEFVKDLTPNQRSRIEALTAKHSKKATQYRKQLEVLRDSIRVVMELQGDQSAILFPMYEREGRLMAELSKLYYIGRIEIEKELTPEQRKQLEQRMLEEREKGMKQKQGKPVKSQKEKKVRK